MLYFTGVENIAPDRTDKRSVMREILQSRLDELQLSPDAIDWLLGVWDLIQVFDDIADGDAVERADLDRAIWCSMVKMPSNAFYVRHAGWLVPSLAQLVLEWLASDLAEREGRASAQSYMWRAGYYRTVCLVASIEHGPSAAVSEAALSLYGETLEDYRKEFQNA